MLATNQTLTIKWILFIVNTTLRGTKDSHLNLEPPKMLRMVLIVSGPKPICRTIRNRDQFTVRWATCPRSTDPCPNRNLPKCQTLRSVIYTSRTSRRVINNFMISKAYSPPDNPPKSPTWTSKIWWVSLIGSLITDILRLIMERKISLRTEARKKIWYIFRERKVPKDRRGLIPTVQFRAR